jgi:hypothetical protein
LSRDERVALNCLLCYYIWLGLIIVSSAGVLESRGYWRVRYCLSDYARTRIARGCVVGQRAAVEVAAGTSQLESFRPSCAEGGYGAVQYG